MAAAANLILKDRFDANFTMSPVVIKTGEYAKYINRIPTVLALQPTAALAYSESASVRKVSGTLVYPLADALGVVKTSYAKFELTLDKSQEDWNRDEILSWLKSFVADAIVEAAVINGETPW